MANAVAVRPQSGEAAEPVHLAELFVVCDRIAVPARMRFPAQVCVFFVRKIDNLESGISAQSVTFFILSYFMVFFFFLFYPNLGFHPTSGSTLIPVTKNRLFW
jgi:hypothetical protein